MSVAPSSAPKASSSSKRSTKKKAPRHKAIPSHARHPTTTTATHPTSTTTTSHPSPNRGGLSVAIGSRKRLASVAAPSSLHPQPEHGQTAAEFYGKQAGNVESAASKQNTNTIPHRHHYQIGLVPEGEKVSADKGIKIQQLSTIPLHTGRTKKTSFPKSKGTPIDSPSALAQRHPTVVSPGGSIVPVHPTSVQTSLHHAIQSRQNTNTIPIPAQPSLPNLASDEHATVQAGILARGPDNTGQHNTDIRFSIPLHSGPKPPIATQGDVHGAAASENKIGTLFGRPLQQYYLLSHGTAHHPTVHDITKGGPTGTIVPVPKEIPPDAKPVPGQPGVWKDSRGVLWGMEKAGNTQEEMQQNRQQVQKFAAGLTKQQAQNILNGPHANEISPAFRQHLQGLASSPNATHGNTGNTININATGAPIKLPTEKPVPQGTPEDIQNLGTAVGKQLEQPLAKGTDRYIPKPYTPSHTFDVGPAHIFVSGTGSKDPKVVKANLMDRMLSDLVQQYRKNPNDAKLTIPTSPNRDYVSDAEYKQIQDHAKMIAGPSATTGTRIFGIDELGISVKSGRPFREISGVLMSTNNPAFHGDWSKLPQGGFPRRYSGAFHDQLPESYTDKHPINAPGEAEGNKILTWGGGGTGELYTDTPEHNNPPGIHPLSVGRDFGNDTIPADTSDNLTRAHGIPITKATGQHTGVGNAPATIRPSDHPANQSPIDNFFSAIGSGLGKILSGRNPFASDSPPTIETPEIPLAGYAFVDGMGRYGKYKMSRY